MIPGARSSSPPGGPARGSGETRRTTAALIDAFTRIIGPPVSTPVLTSVGDGRREPTRYRVHRWECPACGAGSDDPIYRPMVIDSDGRVFCDASRCSPAAIGAAVRALATSAELRGAL